MDGNRGLAILVKINIPSKIINRPIACGENVEVLAITVTNLNNTLDKYNIYKRQDGALDLSELFAHI